MAPAGALPTAIKTEAAGSLSQMCLPLSQAIEKGLQKHLGGMMEDPQLIAAASFCKGLRPLGLTDVIEAGKSSSLQYWSAYFFLPQ